MRPVDKGVPSKLYTNYQDALPDLRKQLGDYCSYCERQIETHLAIEHIQPKSHAPTLRNEWANLLLACANCSCKGHNQIRLSDYLWPDSDNTLRSFEYVKGGFVQVSSRMPAHIQAKARATIILTGLDKDPGNPDPDRRPTGPDRRWQRRFEIWQIAEKDRLRLTSNNTVEVKELIVENAIARGMFSIWWTVFAGDTDMRRRLRKAFLGTAACCFDANENLQPRVGGQV